MTTEVLQLLSPTYFLPPMPFRPPAALHRLSWPSLFSCFCCWGGMPGLAVNWAGLSAEKNIAKSSPFTFYFHSMKGLFGTVVLELLLASWRKKMGKGLQWCAGWQTSWSVGWQGPLWLGLEQGSCGFPECNEVTEGAGWPKEQIRGNRRRGWGGIVGSPLSYWGSGLGGTWVAWIGMDNCLMTHISQLTTVTGIAGIAITKQCYGV